jgi:hypothetical protein
VSPLVFARLALAFLPTQLDGIHANPSLPTKAPCVAGLPPFTGDEWTPLVNTGRQIGLAVIICLVDVCESISIAKAMARVNKWVAAWFPSASPACSFSPFA